MTMTWPNKSPEPTAVGRLSFHEKVSVMPSRRSAVAALLLGHESYFEIFRHWLQAEILGCESLLAVRKRVKLSMILASQLCKLVVCLEVG